jgi:multicomponent Na+:H+ antiporter subunit F
MFAAAGALLATIALRCGRGRAGGSTAGAGTAMLPRSGVSGRSARFLDLALTYGLLNVIGTIAVLKFFRRGSLGDAGPGDSLPPAAGPQP